MAIRLVGTSKRCANSSVAVRTVRMQTSAESGRRFPAAWPGELHPLDRHGELGHLVVDGHEGGLGSSRAGARRQHKAGGSGFFHRCHHGLFIQQGHLGPGGLHPARQAMTTSTATKSA